MEFKDYSENKAGSYQEMWNQIIRDVVNTLKEKFERWSKELGRDLQKGDRFHMDAFDITIK